MSPHTNPPFRRAALVGKFPNAGLAAQGESRALLADVAGFLADCGCEVFLEESTARHLDHLDYRGKQDSGRPRLTRFLVRKESDLD